MQGSPPRSGPPKFPAGLRCPGISPSWPATSPGHPQMPLLPAVAPQGLSDGGLQPDFCPAPLPTPPRPLVIGSCWACPDGCPVPLSPRPCPTPGPVASLGAATRPVASLLAPLPITASPRATSLHRNPSRRSACPRRTGSERRLKNRMEEAGESPRTGVPSGRSPGVFGLRLLPGSG